jgi:hypothetical protein
MVHQRAKDKVRKDPKLAMDQTEDHNNINLNLFIGFGLKTVSLALIILNTSYFFGIFWYLLCQFTIEFYNLTHEKLGSCILPNCDDDHYGKMNFLVQYDLGNFNNERVVILLMYYSFTSLTTIGFGDISPANNVERIFCAVMFFVIGVSLFSYIMGNFIDILNRFKCMDQGNEQEDELNMFFEMLKRFNDGELYKQKFKDDVLAFFLYKWREDKN